jgi:hypothetical protein
MLKVPNTKVCVIMALATSVLETKGEKSFSIIDQTDMTAHFEHKVIKATFHRDLTSL